MDSSITSFARSCFNYALETKQSLWFSAKDTISKTYDHHFKDVFRSVYDEEYKEKFENTGIEYFYTLIDDAVARVIKSEGGFIWACKNYDGDVMSDMGMTAFGALAMMTSVLVSPDGKYEFEAAHGTVQRHFYKYREGEKRVNELCGDDFCMDRRIEQKRSTGRKRGTLQICKGSGRRCDRNHRVRSDDQRSFFDHHHRKSENPGHGRIYSGSQSHIGIQAV